MQGLLTFNLCLQLQVQISGQKNISAYNYTYVPALKRLKMIPPPPIDTEIQI